MAQSPTLSTANLNLVPFADRHMTQTYVDWLQDPILMRYSEQRHRSHDLESCRRFVESFATSPHFLWAIEAVDQDHKHIGNITATLDPNNGLADIGLLIGADRCQGRGYGSQAWQAVMTYLHTLPHLHKITGGCLAPNTAMVRIMQNAGMIPDGRRKNHYLVDQCPTDIVYFAQWIDR